MNLRASGDELQTTAGSSQIRQQAPARREPPGARHQGLILMQYQPNDAHRLNLLRAPKQPRRHTACCSCGWKSQPLRSEAAARRAHAQHVREATWAW